MVVVAAALIAGGGVAAATGVFTTQDSQAALTGGVMCADRASLTDANIAVIWADNASPVETCRRLWRQGVMAADDAPDPRPASLTACVLATSGVGVFPGGPGTCENLDLQEYRVDAAAAANVAELRQRISRDLVQFGPNCTSLNEGQIVISRDLRRAGFVGWRVDVDPQGAPLSSCATYAIDAKVRRVLILPSPE